MNLDYDKECKALIEKTCKQSHALYERYKDGCSQSRGLDGDPSKKAFDDLRKSFSTELKALKKKYGIEDHHGER